MVVFWLTSCYKLFRCVHNVYSKRCNETTDESKILLLRPLTKQELDDETCYQIVVKHHNEIVDESEVQTSRYGVFFPVG